MEHRNPKSNPLHGEGFHEQQNQQVEPPQVEAPSRQENQNKLPLFTMQRIMRQVLPNHAEVSNDSKPLVQSCVTEFIAFITKEANQRCKEDNRQTLSSEDLIDAMAKLGFEKYSELLTIYLNRYRQQNEEGGGGASDQVQNVAAGSVPSLPSVANDHGVQVPPPMLEMNNNVMLPPIDNLIHPFPFEYPTMGYDDGLNGVTGGAGGSGNSSADGVNIDPFGDFNHDTSFGGN